GLRKAYLQQRENVFLNMARKRACTNKIVQALNLSGLFQCPPLKRLVFILYSKTMRDQQNACVE
ncbi:MAG: hypothetical protein WCX31_08700, partial [Salinivirgaceae bacterium]